LFFHFEAGAVAVTAVAVRESNRENMDNSLLLKERQEKAEGCLSLTWAAFVQEAKRAGYLAGPMVAVNLSQYFLQIISIMMVGHLGELSLSSTAIAISLAAVTGFSPVVSAFSF
jgi:MATE family multidrug resistance protein